MRKRAQAAGCVLAGGRSRRMGTDKALLELGGKPLIALALEAFEGFPEVLVSAGQKGTYLVSCKIVPDERPGMGPLGGIISVLKAADACHVCFRPVDAPLVPPELHTILADAFAKGGTPAANAATVEASPAETPEEGPKLQAIVPIYKGKPEPLLACFAKTALPVLESLAAEGKYKAAEAFPLLNTQYIDLEAPSLLSRLGDPAAYLINANTPETFSALK